MNPAPPISHRRYRRRIVGLGAAAFVLIFAVGAAFAVPEVEDDLENRLTDRLAGDGIDGLSISFSGQDGTIDCAVPLADPEAVRERAEDLYGVRAIDLDRSCIGAASAEAPADSAPSTSEPATSTPVATDPAPTGPSTTVPPVTEPPLESLVEIIGGDPLFGELSGLLEAADLLGTDGLNSVRPVTVLAPTDAAFDAAFDTLGADAFEAFTSDTELLRSVLLHHLTAGERRVAVLDAGPITMFDETDVIVDPAAAGGITFTSGDSVAGVEDPATQLDIAASNGVVHAIDAILFPEGFEIAVGGATTVASLAEGRLVLTGTVQSDEQRQALVDAAEAVVDPANVGDELVVDESVEVSDDDIDRLAGLVGSMPANLVEGEATLVGSDLSLSGVTIDADARTAVDEAVLTANADAALSVRDAADADSAQDLQDELNAFVAANPILFEQSSAELTEDANAVIEQVAARARSLDGIAIVIVGYTDTDGDADNNQLLSEGRAASVLQALVNEGLDADTLTSTGEGESAPILDDDGVEDKAASRRVEFVVTVIDATN